MTNFNTEPTNTSDSGQGLLFALMFLALFGVWIAAVLGLATNDLVGTGAVAKQRNTTFAADSAVYAAFQIGRQTAFSSLPNLCDGSTVVAVPATGTPTTNVSCTAVSFSSDYEVTFTAKNIASGNVVLVATVIYGPTQFVLVSWADES